MPLFGANTNLAVPAGGFIVVLFAYILLRALYLFFTQRDKISLGVILLLFISGGFVLSAAFGRHCLGLNPHLHLDTTCL